MTDCKYCGKKVDLFGTYRSEPSTGNIINYDDIVIHTKPRSDETKIDFCRDCLREQAKFYLRNDSGYKGYEIYPTNIFIDGCNVYAVLKPGQNISQLRANFGLTSRNACKDAINHALGEDRHIVSLSVKPSSQKRYETVRIFNDDWGTAKCPHCGKIVNEELDACSVIYDPIDPPDGDRFRVKCTGCGHKFDVWQSDKEKPHFLKRPRVMNSTKKTFLKRRR